MRRFSVAMACIAVTVLALSLVRLGDSLAQLRAVEAPRAARSDAGERPPVEPSRAGVTAPKQLITVTPPEVSGPYEEAAGDENILRALTQDPDFQRAAAELLQDPDAAVRAEAEVLLRDLGL